MARIAKPVREFTVKDIAENFVLAPIGDSGPIGKNSHSAGWYIRVRTSIAINPDRSATLKFDYFLLDDDGNILTAPRGYAKDYKPGRVVDIKPMAMMADIVGGRA